MISSGSSPSARRWAPAPQTGSRLVPPTADGRRTRTPGPMPHPTTGHRRPHTAEAAPRQAPTAGRGSQPQPGSDPELPQLLSPNATSQRVLPWTRNAFETIEHRRAQLMEGSERELHLRLDADGPQDAKVRSRADRVVKQRRLAHTRLAAEYEGAALAAARRVEEDDRAPRTPRRALATRPAWTSVPGPPLPRAHARAPPRPTCHPGVPALAGMNGGEQRLSLAVHLATEERYTLRRSRESHARSVRPMGLATQAGVLADSTAPRSGHPRRDRHPSEEEVS